MDTRNKIFVVVGTVAILAAAGTVGALLFTQPDATTTPRPTASQNSASDASVVTSVSNGSTSTVTGSYKDGTYTATQTYSVPHEETNSIKVTVTIASSKIMSVTTNNNYTDRESGQYINQFENNASAAVVGQSIGSTSRSRIAGASLTSSAFYDALDVIATQAKA